jgi:hypothetical protein
MAIVVRKGKKVPAEGTPDHFEKMLEGPYPNHAYPIKHAYKDCRLMKKFLSGAPRRETGKRSPTSREMTLKRRRTPS